MSEKDTTSERIEKGIVLVQDAIKDGDAKLLSTYIMHFVNNLKAPTDKILEAIKNCPVGLLEEAGLGFRIKMTSDVLKKDIILGKDVSWQEVEVLIRDGIKGDDLRKILEIREMFDGKIITEGYA